MQGPDKGGGDRRTHKRTNESPLRSTGLRPLWGRCPKGHISGRRGLKLGLRGQSSGLSGQIEDLRGQIPGLKGEISGLGSV